ncbi:MAG: hypothetical protein K1X35_01615 [Caulobacteraceae bacterium]|nr:hypothetical protein [Caulobacteraceae bacterium]
MAASSKVRLAFLALLPALVFAVPVKAETWVEIGQHSVAWYGAMCVDRDSLRYDQGRRVFEVDTCRAPGGSLSRHPDLFRVDCSQDLNRPFFLEKWTSDGWASTDIYAESLADSQPEDPASYHGGAARYACSH